MSDTAVLTAQSVGSSGLEQRTEAQIEKVDCVLKGGVPVSYYVDSEHQSRLEAILPPEEFKGRITGADFAKVRKSHYPDKDKEIRDYTKFDDSLIPFRYIVKCAGYVGLDVSGYLHLSDVLSQRWKQEIREAIEDGTLKSFPIFPYTCPGHKVLLKGVKAGLLEERVVEGKKVYFPTEQYVRANAA
jgi:hypothetical protein